MASPAQIQPAVSPRLLSLDLLRLAAVVLVLGRHMEAPPTNLPGYLYDGLNKWHLTGGRGVDLFFVLSGFLVAGLLFAEYKRHGDLSIKNFYLRRGWKIYPAFYFLLAFTFLFQWFVIGERMRDRQFFTELFFIQGYQMSYWNHTWSLAVEEHFYIALPLVLLWLVRRNRGATDPFRALPYLVALTSLTVFGVRVLNYALRDEYSIYTHVFPSFLRVDALFFGVALGYAYHFHHAWFERTFRPWRYPLMLLGAALFWMPLPLGDNVELYVHTIGFTQHYLGAAAILVGVLCCRIPNHRVTLALATLGTFSYSVYLWHMALMRWAIPPLRDAGVPWSVRTLIYIVGAFVIGIAMAKLLELPVLKFRDRKYPSRSIGTLDPSLAADAAAADQRRAA